MTIKYDIAIPGSWEQAGDGSVDEQGVDSLNTGTLAYGGDA